MKMKVFLALTGALALAGCGESSYEMIGGGGGMASAEYAVKEDVARAEIAEGSSEPIPVSVPRIAYTYNYGFRLSASAIPVLQRKHADLCESQGPKVCRILGMGQSGSEGEYASGSLSLEVAAPQAREFGEKLANMTADADGKQVSSAIRGEDLSKQIVDTEARLRSRIVLRDRLMEILKTRKGTVAELVQAERGVANANEEIDRARSWLAEMQGRVDFSRMNISYSSASPSRGGFMAPIRDAVGSLGTVLGSVIAAIIIGVTVLVPLGLLGWALIAGIRWIRRRRPDPDTQSISDTTDEATGSD